MGVIQEWWEVFWDGWVWMLYSLNNDVTADNAAQVTLVAVIVGLLIGFVIHKYVVERLLKTTTTKYTGTVVATLAFLGIMHLGGALVFLAAWMALAGVAVSLGIAALVALAIWGVTKMIYTQHLTVEAEGREERRVAKESLLETKKLEETTRVGEKLFGMEKTRTDKALALAKKEEKLDRITEEIVREMREHVIPQLQNAVAANNMNSVVPLAQRLVENANALDSDEIRGIHLYQTLEDNFKNIRINNEHLMSSIDKQKHLADVLSNDVRTLKHDMKLLRNTLQTRKNNPTKGFKAGTPPATEAEINALFTELYAANQGVSKIESDLTAADADLDDIKIKLEAIETVDKNSIAQMDTKAMSATGKVHTIIQKIKTQAMKLSQDARSGNIANVKNAIPQLRKDIAEVDNWFVRGLEFDTRFERDLQKEEAKLGPIDNELADAENKFRDIQMNIEHFQSRLSSAEHHIEA